MKVLYNVIVLVLSNRGGMEVEEIVRPYTMYDWFKGYKVEKKIIYLLVDDFSNVNCHVPYNCGEYKVMIRESKSIAKKVKS